MKPLIYLSFLISAFAWDTTITYSNNSFVVDLFTDTQAPYELQIGSCLRTISETRLVDTLTNCGTVSSNTTHTTHTFTIMFQNTTIERSVSLWNDWTGTDDFFVVPNNMVLLPDSCGSYKSRVAKLQFKVALSGSYSNVVFSGMLGDYSNVDFRLGNSLPLIQISNGTFETKDCLQVRPISPTTCTVTLDDMYVRIYAQRTIGGNVVESGLSNRMLPLSDFVSPYCPQAQGITDVSATFMATVTTYAVGSFYDPLYVIMMIEDSDHVSVEILDVSVTLYYGDDTTYGSYVFSKENKERMKTIASSPYYSDGYFCKDTCDMVGTCPVDVGSNNTKMYDAFSFIMAHWESFKYFDSNDGYIDIVVTAGINPCSSGRRLDGELNVVTAAAPRIYTRKRYVSTTPEEPPKNRKRWWWITVPILVLIVIIYKVV